MDCGDPILFRSGRGSTVRIGDVTLYPPDDPVGHAVRRAAGAKLLPRTLVFVPSVGLGYGLAELLARLPDRSAVLCVESRQEVMALAIGEGLPRDPRLLVLRADGEEAVAQALTRMGPQRFRRVTRVVLSGGYRLDPAYYERVHALLTAEIRTYWQNRVTLIGMGSLWVRNLFDNLALLPEAGDLGALSTSLPVIVAGAGPSLEDTLPVLKASRSRFTLVAADTALPALAAAGVVPDLVLVLEAQAVNLLDFLPFRGPPLRVACDLASCPAVPRLFAGATYLFSSAFAPLALFARLRDAGLLPCPFPPLGSVGVAAAYAALRLTRQGVYLTGLDFAYPQGRTHARGTPVHLAMLAASGRCRPVGQDGYAAYVARPRTADADKGGRPVATDTVLRSYRDQLRRSVGGDAGRVRDAGTTGLALGPERISLAELSSRLESGGESGERLAPAPPLHAESSGVRAFLGAEMRLLDEADAMMGRLLGGGAGEIAEEEAELLRAVEHAFVHFPDEPDFAAPGKSFLARGRVAVRYYSRRLARVASRLS